MADYKRMVSYMYQYENGVKRKNVGFVRVEAKGGQCKITLHMQLLGQLDSIFPTYLIQRKDHNLDLIYLGDTVLKNQIMDSRLSADENNIMGSGYKLSDMGGLLLFLNDNVYFATEWDDKPVVASEVLEALRPKKSRQAVSKNQDINPYNFRSQEYGIAKEQQEEKIEEELKIPTYKLPGGWKMVERRMGPGNNSESVQLVDNHEDIHEEIARLKDMDKNDQEIIQSDIFVEDAIQDLDSYTQSYATEDQETYTQNYATEDQETYTQNYSTEDQETYTQNYATEDQESYTQNYATEDQETYTQNYATEDQETYTQNYATEDQETYPQTYTTEDQETYPQNYAAEDQASYPQNYATEDQAPYTQSHTAEAQASYTQPYDMEADNQQETKQMENSFDEEAHTVFSNMQDAEGVRETDASSCMDENAMLIDPPTAKHILANYPKIYPFEDNEIIQCVKIEPKDIGLLPKEIWPLSNNSFLMHGYYCYHHLIFAKMKNRFGCGYILGIPGIFHGREQFMARMFGFESFKSIRKRELKQGDFGYWYIPVYL